MPSSARASMVIKIWFSFLLLHLTGSGWNSGPFLRKLSNLNWCCLSWLLLFCVLLLFWLAVGAARAFAELSARYSHGEALAIPLQTTRFLACASFSVRNFFSIIIVLDLGLKSVRVSLLDLLSCVLDNLSVLIGIAAVSASTVGTATDTVCKAFTI